jgi:hypothetical protein
VLALSVHNSLTLATASARSGRMLCADCDHFVKGSANYILLVLREAELDKMRAQLVSLATKLCNLLCFSLHFISQQAQIPELNVASPDNPTPIKYCLSSHWPGVGTGSLLHVARAHKMTLQKSWAELKKEWLARAAQERKRRTVKPRARAAKKHLHSTPSSELDDSGEETGAEGSTQTAWSECCAPNEETAAQSIAKELELRALAPRAAPILTSHSVCTLANEAAIGAVTEPVSPSAGDTTGASDGTIHGDGAREVKRQLEAQIMGILEAQSKLHSLTESDTVKKMKTDLDRRLERLSDALDRLNAKEDAELLRQVLRYL